MKRGLLDESQCRKVPKGRKSDSYTIWIEQYRKSKKQALSNDFMGHHNDRYGEKVPIWVATEFLDFGSTTRLLGFLPKELQSEIALSFGVLEGSVLVSWARNYNFVRNIVAHHSRLWNRHVVTRLTVDEAVVDVGLYHLTAARKSGNFKKLYPTLATLAYVLSFVDPGGDWRLRTASLIRDFPEIPNLGPTTDMAFPANWESLDVWNGQVAFRYGIGDAS